MTIIELDDREFDQMVQDIERTHERTQEKLNDMEYESKMLCRVCKLQDKVKDQIYCDLYKQVVYSKLEQGKCSAWIQDMYQQVEDLRKGSDTNHLWITINPEDRGEQTLSNLQESIQKLTQKTFVKLMEWTFEQRGDEEQSRGKGVHVHILLSLKEKKPRLDSIKRAIKSCFQQLVGNPRCMDIRKCPDTRVEDKLLYLQGEKWDEEKESKIDQDKIWRQENNLSDIYRFCANNHLSSTE